MNNLDTGVDEWRWNPFQVLTLPKFWKKGHTENNVLMF